MDENRIRSDHPRRKPLTRVSVVSISSAFSRKECNSESTCFFVSVLPSTLGPIAMLRSPVLSLVLLLAAASAFAQGGPPFYTNDPGTPGNLNWEINLSYMPFFYSHRSVSHTPDLDINFGVGNRIQLTYENAWLRVQNPSSATEFGLGQSNLGFKWRFYDAGESGLNISVFPSSLSTTRTMRSAGASLLRAILSSCPSNSPGDSAPSG